MDKFFTKSPVNSDEKTLKRKGNDYDKQYDAKKEKEISKWAGLQNFLGLHLLQILASWSAKYTVNVL